MERTVGHDSAGQGFAWRPSRSLQSLLNSTVATKGYMKFSVTILKLLGVALQFQLLALKISDPGSV